jgi:saccharopine dehydrogenase (NAD+, L-lysine-forming)
MKATILGCGTVGSTAALTLSASGQFSELAIADLNVEAAMKVASVCQVEAEAIKCDASDVSTIKEVIRGSDVVLNCVGPFYEYGPRVLKAAIQGGVNYVDVCDDYDATVEHLKMDIDAKKAEITALIGMGSSPGLANLIAKFAAENLLDEVDAIDIYHAHGGERTEGAAVVKHRIHSMEMDIPVFLDGEFKTVRLFEESGKALEKEVEFPGIGVYRVYAYPHPETLTLPRYIKGVRRVTNLGLVLPPEYAELIKTIVRIGMTSDKPIKVGNTEISPLDFAVAFILSKREELLEKAGLKGPVGCLKVVVTGKKGGIVRYSFSLTSRGQGMGEGTGIPAAIGTILMVKGKITEKGVLPPEACVNPMDAFVMARDILKSSGIEEFPLLIEVEDESGKRMLSVDEVLKW